MSFDLTNKNIQDTFQNLLQKTGSEGRLYDLVGNQIDNLTIGGTLTAHSYVTSESIVNTSSGSTAFGNSSDDTHKFTGDITASNNISASGNIFATAFVAGTAGTTRAADMIATLAGNVSASGDLYVGGRDIYLGKNNSVLSTISADVSGRHTISGYALTLTGSSEVNINSNANINFNTGSNNVNRFMTIHGTNNALGIGTQNPQAKLHAEGDISASGRMTSNYSTLIGGVSNSPSFVMSKELTGTINTAAHIYVGGGGATAGNIKLGDADTSEGVFLQGDPTANNYIRGTLYIGKPYKYPEPVGSKLTVEGDISGSGNTFFGSAISQSHTFTGHITASGVISASGGFVGSLTGQPSSISNLIASDGANRVLTSDNDGTLTAEANLTFNGSTLTSAAQGNEFTGPMELNTDGGDSTAFSVAGENDSAILMVSPQDYTDKVGIGTAQPTSKLHVDGDLKTNSHITASGNISSSGNVISDIVRTEKIHRKGSTNNHITLASNYVTTIGDVDNSANSSKLVIDDGNEQAYFTSGDTDTFALGVNTTTPTDASLEVKGNISSSGNLQVDSYIQTDSHITASGNISASATSRITSYEFFAKTRYGFQGTDSQIRISGDTINIAPGDSETIDVRDGSTKFIGPITASGNISASGTLIGNAITLPNDSISGDLIEGGTIGSTTITDLTATKLNVTHFTSSFITSSTIQTEGSNIFGDTIADTHKFNGHITASGNIKADGNISASGYITADRLDINDSKFADKIDLINFGIGNNSLGSLTLSHITASGQISSSGTGDNYFGGTINMGDNKGIENPGRASMKAGSRLTFFGGNSNQGFISFLSGSTNQTVMTIDASTNRGKVKIGEGADASSTKSRLTIGGDLTVESHITASGNISASGGIIATGDINSDGTIIGDGLNINGTTRIEDDNVLITTGPDPASLTSAVTIVGDINTNSHITASGNISGSSTSTLSIGGNSIFRGSISGMHTVGGNGTSLILSKDSTSLVNPGADIYVNGNLKVATHITASGNISASGEVKAGSIVANGVTTTGAFLTSDGRIYEDGGELIIGSNPTAITLAPSPTLIRGNITASGNISASGDLISKELYLDNAASIRNQSGNVRLRIGAPSNNSSLELTDGDFNVSGHITSSGNISASNTDGTHTFGGTMEIGNPAGAYGTTARHTNDILSITNANAVPDIRLNKGVGGTNWQLGGDTGVFFHLSRNGTKGLTVDNNLQFGFGTTGPTKRVQVTGDISASGGQWLEGNLTLGNSAASHSVDGLTVAGDISASGDLYLESSKNIYFDETDCFIQGNGATLTVDGDNYVNLKADTQVSVTGGGGMIVNPAGGNLSAPNWTATGVALTAKGDISGSGFLYLKETGSAFQGKDGTGAGYLFASSSGQLCYQSGSTELSVIALGTGTGGGGGSGDMSDVVDDTSPQLGGELDLNSNDITGTGNINITGDISGSNKLGIGDMTHHRATVNIKTHKNHLGQHAAIYMEESASGQGEGYRMGVNENGDFNIYNSDSTNPVFTIDDANQTIPIGKTIISASGIWHPDGSSPYGLFDLDAGVSGSVLKTRIARTNGGVRDKRLEIDAFITSSGPISTLSHITASSHISTSGDLIGNQLVLQGGTFTSTSLAAAQAGADNLGNHIASQDLDLDDNSIKDALHITASGNITASGDLYVGGDIILKQTGNLYFNGTDTGDRIEANGSSQIDVRVNNSQAAVFRQAKVGIPGYHAGDEPLNVEGVASASSFVSNTHITASGNISASGYVTASTYYGDGSNLTGVTATADPAGSDTHVQFNDGGSTGGDAGFTYNKTTDSITLAGHITASGEISASGTIISNDIITNHNALIYNTSSVSSTGNAQGDIVKFGATTTVAGAIYAHTGSGWVLAHSGSGGYASSSLGFAIGTNSSTDGMLLRGMANMGYNPGGDNGCALYLETPGSASNNLSGTSGHIVRVIGWNYGGETIYFNPDNTWVKVS